MIDWQVFLPAIGAAAVLATVSVPTAIKFATQYQLYDLPGEHKRHKRPVPILGGAALFVVFWLVMLVVTILWPDILGDQLPVMPYVLAGALIVFLVGLSDDLRPVSAWTKLLAQIAAGVVLFIGGMGVDPLTIPFYGAVETGPFAGVITVVWVVGLTNAINIIDGLDGLAAGVSLVACLTLAVVAGVFNVEPVSVLSGILAGFLAVFLFFNRHPARIFLGDSGSMQIGYYFAVISLLVPIRIYTASALYLPLLTLGVPLLEVVTSFSRRLASGKSVMKADRRHLFHYLSLAGLSPRGVVLVFWGLSVVFGLFTVAMLYLDRRWVAGFLALFMVVVLVLFYIFISNLSRGRRGVSRRQRQS